MLYRTTPPPYSDRTRSLTPACYHIPCAQDRPILHHTLYFVDEIGTLRTPLQNLVETLKAETPIAAAWSVVPNISRKVSQEMMLRALETSILRDAVESATMLYDGVI